MTVARPSWTRLEPQARDISLKTGLRAEIYDPLWLLARQRQFGELQGEDAGSPVWVDAHIDCRPLTRYHPGELDGAAGTPYDGQERPLEAMVEAEPPVLAGERPIRLAVTAGLHFLGLLEAEGLASYRDAYRRRHPLVLDAGLDTAARRYASVVGRHAVDGLELQRELAAALNRSGGELPAEPVIAEADRAAVKRAAHCFLAWYDAIAGPSESGPDAAWMPGRIEYQVSVGGPSATGEDVFSATEYDQGRLDWSSFDLAPAGTSLGASADPTRTEIIRRTGLPTPVTYRGMPAPRFWQFEDAAIDFGDLTAARSDLTRAQLIKFAILYGNDHYVIPVDVDLGSICRIPGLSVVDTFNEVVDIPHISEADALQGRSGRFRLFEPSTPESTSRTPLLFLPPTIGPELCGPPIEEVHLLHDEGANLGWAVEIIAADADGFPVDRGSQPRGASQPEPVPRPDHGEAVWRYRLRTDVPEHWYPIVPVADSPGINHLELRSLTRHDGAPVPPPWGRMLRELAPADGPPTHLAEAEISRATTRVTRAWQVTRWTDGRHHSWIGRRRQASSINTSSGLRFDVVSAEGGAGTPP